MPLSKFRSVEEMAAAEATRETADPASNLRTSFALSELCRRLSGRHLPPGVHRFRSVEEARRQRDAWDGLAQRDPDAG
jgi:hypothetical protein